MIKCEYCSREFKQEVRAATHMCEKKRRWIQKDYPETVAGFNAFDLFYRLGMQSKPKEYKDFADSQYYSAFVNFGSYCIRTAVIDFEAYVRWLIRKQVKLKDWATDTMYMLFVQDHLKKEQVERALERFVEYASKTSYFETFWESAGGYLIADWVESGKISPWVLVCSDRAQRAVNTMNSEQLTRIANAIDADYWGKKIKQNPVDAEWVRHIIDGVNQKENTVGH